MHKEQKEKSTDKSSENLVEQMFTAGAHYGYSKTRRHPSVASVIYTTKNNSDIIDLEQTVVMLETANEFIKSLGAQNKTILFVGTKPEAKMAVKNVAESLGMPYVVERWIGGTLSNFTEIKKRIAELENYHKESKEGGLEKYTKKERGVIAKKMERLSIYYSGLIGLKKTPDALFIVDARAEHIAQKEAKGMNVPVVALVNSDSNIREIEFPIIANDSGLPSIKLFTEAVSAAYKAGTASIHNLA